MNQNVSPAAGDAWSRVAESVAGQHWPAATLYVVATPIGNLGDLGLRAWHALQRADVIAAEDTRASRKLLDAWGVGTPLMAAHRHNEASAAQAICERLAQGQRVALVSDAGAPAVSDPGARVVRAVREAGYAVVPVPGPSAVIAALMGSGVTSDENPAFAFAGFAPPKAAARQRWLRTWCALPAPVVMFESPHRLAATLADLLEVCGPARKLTVARELTKRFEEIATFALGEGAAWLAADPHREQGEFVLIVHADEAGEDEGEVDARADALLDALLETLSARRGQGGGQVTGLPRTRCTAGRCARRPRATGRRDRGSYWHGLCNGRVRQARRPRRTAGLPGHAHAAGRDAPGRQRQGPARGVVHRPGAAAFVRRLAARRIESDPGTGAARAGGVVRQGPARLRGGAGSGRHAVPA